MLAEGARPRELHWYHAGPMLFGDWGTSRLYVLGLCFFFAGHGSIWLMLAMSALLLAVAWAYQVICRLYPDGGGVYSSARHRSALLGVIGGLLLCADYVVTAALSALDAFHYLHLAHAEIWAAASIVAIGLVNYFGPRHSGTGALVVALLTVVLTMTIALAALPHLGQARIDPPEGNPWRWWAQFTSIILAISGVEAIANMTGIMVEPVAKTARRSIFPVVLEIVVLNLVLTLAMQAIPVEALGDGDPAQATVAHRDSMLRLLAEYYVGPVFAAVSSLVFALLLLSAVNTAITDLVSIQYMMARDKELPAGFGKLNEWGMPVVSLALAAAAPLIVVLAVPDVGHLADLYAIGVVGAVAVNLGTTSTNRELEMGRIERTAMQFLAILMIVIWVTIAWEKPWALVFALSIMTLGLIGRWAAHNRERIRAWFLEPIPHPWGLPTPTSGAAVLAAPRPATPTPHVYAPGNRIMVATRGNLKLLQFALEQAKARQAELLCLFVRHVAVVPMGRTRPPEVEQDEEASATFKAAAEMAEREGVPIRPLYAVTGNVADTILDFAVTHGVDYLILGASQRGPLWRVMKGDVLEEVGQYLPESVKLLIHA